MPFLANPEVSRCWGLAQPGVPTYQITSAQAAAASNHARSHAHAHRNPPRQVKGGGKVTEAAAKPGVKGGPRLSIVEPLKSAGVFVAQSAVVVGHVTIGKGSSIWYGATLRGARRWLFGRVIGVGGWLVGRDEGVAFAPSCGAGGAKGRLSIVGRAAALSDRSRSGSSLEAHPINHPRLYPRNQAT